jgi:WD40 repeat protein
VLAVAGSDSQVRLFALEGAVVPRPLGSVKVPGSKPLYAAGWSPDGHLLAVGGQSGHVTVLDLTDPSAASVRWTARPAEGGQVVQDLAFAPDGRTLLAAGNKSQLRRWRVDDRELRPLPPLTVPVDSLIAVAVAPDGTVAVGGDEGLLQLWRTTGPRWQLVRDQSLAGAGHAVRSVAFSPDGTLLAAGTTDGVVRVHDAATGRPVTELVGAFTSWVNALTFDEGGHTLAAAASGGVVQLWRTADWELTNTLHGPANYTSVTFHEGTDRVVTADIDGMVRLLELAGPQLPPAGDSIWGLAAPDDGTVAYVGVGSGDPQVLRLDVSDPLDPQVEEVIRWRGKDGDTLDGVVAVAPDGDVLVAGTSQGRLVVWRDPDGDRRQVAVVHPAEQLIENLAFSGDGTLVAATADDGSTSVYAVEGDGLAPVAGTQLEDGALALGVALSSDGAWVATGGTDRLVHLWRTDDPQSPPVVLEGFENNVYSLAFSPDGTLLAGGSTDGTVRVWDVTDPEDPTALATLRGPADTVFSVDFDSGGRMLAAASQDGMVWLWEWDDSGTTPHARPYARLGSLDADLYQVLALPGSDVVLAAGSDGRAGGWSTDVEAARALVCSTTGTPVTEAEWEQFLPGVPFAPPC